MPVEATHGEGCGNNPRVLRRLRRQGQRLVCLLDVVVLVREAISPLSERIHSKRIAPRDWAIFQAEGNPTGFLPWNRMDALVILAVLAVTKILPRCDKSRYAAPRGSAW